MIYVYTPSKSTGARELVKTIREMDTPARRLKSPVPFKKGDLVVGWGHGTPPVPEGVKVLNPKVISNKYKEHLKLAQAGVPVPALSSGPKEGFIGRSFNHQGGKDLLNGGGHDYWVERIETKREFRIHIFNGVSIRAGMKVPRDGFPNPHPWVRSYDGGWRLSYGPASNEYVKQSVREAAKAAVSALGLDFGAVDVALRKDGVPVVWEVNKAPGLEGGSLKKYAEKLIQLAT
jgi:hypothetical protein